MRVMTPTPEQEATWKTWLAERPEFLRPLAERFDPWTLFRSQSMDHRVTVVGFSGTSTANISLLVEVGAAYNLLAYERVVFEVDPNDLTECDLPGPDEEVGIVGAFCNVEEADHT